MNEPVEFSSWLPWAEDLLTEKGESIKTLVVGSHVFLKHDGLFTVRDGFTIDNHALRGKIEQDRNRKVWVCTCVETKR